jgi:hypothetical protein
VGIDPVSIGISIALTAASMAVTMSQHIEGPRLNDLSVTVADYGTPLNYFRGIRRLEVPVFYAERIREVSEENKTKGGKYTQYKYYGTFAVAVADHQISSYRRVWLDRHLVFDATTTDGFVAGDAEEILGNVTRSKGIAGAPFRPYYGTEDQAPDPRMVATVEGDEGVGTCPAYLGIAYLFFEEMPLQNFGNRFPQVSVEADAGTYNTESVSVTGGYDVWYTAYGYHALSPDGTKTAMSDANTLNNRVIIFDNVRGDYNAREIVLSDYPTLAALESTAGTAGAFSRAVIDNAGAIYFSTYDGRRTYKIAADGTLSQVGTTDDLPLNVATFGTGMRRFRITGLFNVGGKDTLIYDSLTNTGQGAYFYTRPTDASTSPVSKNYTTDTGLTYRQFGDPIQDAHGDVWVLTYPSGSTVTEARFYRVAGTYDSVKYHQVTGLPSLGSSNGGTLFGTYYNGLFYLNWGTIYNNSNVVSVDASTFTYTGTRLNLVTAIPDLVNSSQDFLYSGARGPTIDTARNQLVVVRQVGNTGGSSLGGAVIYRFDLPAMTLSPETADTVTVASWSDGPPSVYWPDDKTTYPAVLEWYNPVGGMLALTDRSGDTVSNFPNPALRWQMSDFAFLFTDGVTLGAIASIVADQCGMPAQFRNFSALDQVIPGYSWTQGRGRDVLGPLLDIHDSVIAPKGWKLVGIKRGGALSGPEIREEWFAVTPGGNDARYKVTLIGDTDLPRRVFVVYADMDAEQQPNTAVHQRNAVSVQTVREFTVDITTYADTPDSMQPKVERYLRRQWIGSIKPEMRLSPRHIGMTPGDVRNLVFDNEYIRAFLVRMTIGANRAIATRWERDGAVPIAQITTYDDEGLVATVATDQWDTDTGTTISDTPASEGGTASGRPVETMYAPVDTTAQILDIPLVSDTHDQSVPFLYVGAGPDTSGDWPGADIRQSDSGSDGSFVSGWDLIGPSDKMTHGTAQTVLPNTSADVIDDGSALLISLENGTLTSVTDDQLIADRSLNLLLVGDEFVQFRDAEVQSGNDWLVTGLVRGGGGTEWAMGMHELGERVVLLSSVKRHDMGAAKIGDTDYYTAVTFSRQQTDEPVLTIPFTAAANKPLSPAHVTLTRNAGTGDWTIDFTRRTRIGAANLDGQDVPLGETSEAYKIRILSGATVKRTIETTSQTGNIYSAADQTTDWGSPQTTLTVEVVQMSPTLGLEGFAAAAAA